MPREALRRWQSSKKAKSRQQNAVQKPVLCLVRPGEDEECRRKWGKEGVGGVCVSLELGPTPKQKVGCPL